MLWHLCCCSVDGNAYYLVVGTVTNGKGVMDFPTVGHSWALNVISGDGAWMLGAQRRAFLVESQLGECGLVPRRLAFEVGSFLLSLQLVLRFPMRGSIPSSHFLFFFDTTKAACRVLSFNAALVQLHKYFLHIRIGFW
jgi:hypothetical protein